MIRLLLIFVVLVAADLAVCLFLWWVGSMLTVDAARLRRNRRQRADIREALAKPDVVN